MRYASRHEIYTAYIEGRDLHALIAKRHQRRMVWACVWFTVFFCGALYVAKSLAGIDLFPGVHVWEIFN